MCQASHEYHPKAAIALHQLSEEHRRRDMVNNVGKVKEMLCFTCLRLLFQLGDCAFFYFASCSVECGLSLLIFFPSDRMVNDCVTFAGVEEISRRLSLIHI